MATKKSKKDKPEDEKIVIKATTTQEVLNKEEKPDTKPDITGTKEDVLKMLRAKYLKDGVPVEHAEKFIAQARFNMQEGNYRIEGDTFYLIS